MKSIIAKHIDECSTEENFFVDDNYFALCVFLACANEKKTRKAKRIYGRYCRYFAKNVNTIDANEVFDFVFRKKHELYKKKYKNLVDF